MSLTTRLTSLLGAVADSALAFARDLVGAVEGEDNPETGAPPATPTTQEPLTTATVAALREMLDEHDRGIFLRSALLADLIRRDADVFGALQQRLTAIGALPVCFDPADDTEAALAARDGLAADWARLCPVAVQWDLWLYELLLGFALAQIVWRWDEAHRVLRQSVEAWPASAVEYDRTYRQWYVLTTTGRLAIRPGDGQWVLFASRSQIAPWLWGAIRPTAEWYLSNAYAASDGRRRSEVTGQGIWKAKLPVGARETVEGKGFLRGLRGIGRAAVLPVPQGSTPESSYDVELMEAKADAYRIFEWLKRSGGGAIRLAILGQDLTSQNNQVGTNASSTTGENVTAAVVEAQARGWSECATQQIAAPRSRYLGEPLTRVRIDAEPEVDRKADAEASKATAEAIVAWEEAGVTVDAVAHATAAGMKGATKRVQVRPPPPAPPAAPASGGSARAAARSTRGAPRAASDRPVEEDPDFPFLSFERKGNAGCEICGPLEGVLLPANHAFWDTHTPPMHAHCVCNLLPMDASYADAVTDEDELAALPQAAPGWGTGDAPPTETEK